MCAIHYLLDPTSRSQTLNECLNIVSSVSCVCCKVKFNCMVVRSSVCKPLVVASGLICADSRLD